MVCVTEGTGEEVSEVSAESDDAAKVSKRASGVAEDTAPVNVEEDSDVVGAPELGVGPRVEETRVVGTVSPVNTVELSVSEMELSPVAEVVDSAGSADSVGVTKEEDSSETIADSGVDGAEASEDVEAEEKATGATDGSDEVATIEA